MYFYIIPKYVELEIRDRIRKSVMCNKRTSTGQDMRGRGERKDLNRDSKLKEEP